MSYLCTAIKWSRSAQARVNPLLSRYRGAGLDIAVSVTIALIISGSCEGRKVPVVSGQLAGPDAVRGCGAPEGAVEAGYLADLRRVKVEQHRRHAALRHVAERRLTPIGIRAKDARSRPHLRPNCADYGSPPCRRSTRRLRFAERTAKVGLEPRNRQLAFYPGEQKSRITHAEPNYSRIQAFARPIRSKGRTFRPPLASNRPENAPNSQLSREWNPN